MEAEEGSMSIERFKKDADAAKRTNLAAAQTVEEAKLALEAFSRAAISGAGALKELERAANVISDESARLESLRYQLKRKGRPGWKRLKQR